MHFKGLDLNLLVVLDVLLTEKNTTRAGERLYISQSAVSGALSRIRDYFGDQILVPCGQKMVLTSFAERLVNPVHDILKTTEALISSTTSFDPATSTRSFSLNMSDVSASLVMAQALPLLRKAAPNVHLEFMQAHEKIQDLLEQGEVDFVAVPPMLLSPLHPSEVLFDDTYVCIAWSGNRFLRKGLTMDQFLSLGHVTNRFIKRKETMGDLLLQPSGVKVRFELIVPTFGLVPLAVVGTDLLAIVNKRLALLFSKYMPLKIFPVPFDLPPSTAMLQWNRYHDNDQGTQWIRRLILDSVRDKSFDAQPPT